jgi:hypothetical protein
MAFISVVFGSLKVQENNWSLKNSSAKTNELLGPVLVLTNFLAYFL